MCILLDIVLDPTLNPQGFLLFFIVLQISSYPSTWRVVDSTPGYLSHASLSSHAQQVIGCLSTIQVSFSHYYSWHDRCSAFNVEVIDTFLDSFPILFVWTGCYYLLRKVTSCLIWILPFHELPSLDEGPSAHYSSSETLGPIRDLMGKHIGFLNSLNKAHGV